MYLLFADCSFYASGGAHDLRGVFAALDEAVARGRALLIEEDSYCDWWHVYGLDEGRIVAGTKNQAYGADSIEGGEE